MGCKACERRIESALTALPEIKSVKADSEIGEVAVSYECCFNPAEAMRIISEVGYEPVGVK